MAGSGLAMTSETFCISESGKEKAIITDTGPDDQSHGRPSSHSEELERQEAWDFEYSFGETATEAEVAAETQRRRAHRLASQDLPAPQPPAGAHLQQSIPPAPTMPQRKQQSPPP
ncbi:MAG: hypothetical protein Q9220_000656 [cf. Caloplaca sp. 1 TL-2023]